MFTTHLLTQGDKALGITWGFVLGSGLLLLKHNLMGQGAGLKYGPS